MPRRKIVARVASLVTRPVVTGSAPLKPHFKGVPQGIADEVKVVSERIGRPHAEVSCLVGLDGADLVGETQGAGSVNGCCLEAGERREARQAQQRYLVVDARMRERGEEPWCQPDRALGRDDRVRPYLRLGREPVQRVAEVLQRLIEQLARPARIVEVGLRRAPGTADRYGG
jgi:hypothetical protein